MAAAVPEARAAMMGSLSRSQSSGSTASDAPPVHLRPTICESPCASILFAYPTPRFVPPGRWMHTAVGIGSLMLVYGGMNTSVLPDLSVFNSETLQWRTIETNARSSKDRPSSMAHAAAALENRMWMFGGQEGNRFNRRLYSIDTDTWIWSYHKSDSLPPARAGHAMVSANGHIFMFGGLGKTYYNTLHRLKPTSAEFETLTPSGTPPTPRKGMSLTFDGTDLLVCFGGTTSSGVDGALRVYSISKNKWSSPMLVGSAPSPRTHHAAALMSNNQVIFFGGCTEQGKFLQDTFVLDTRTFAWSSPQSFNKTTARRSHHTCVQMGGRVLIYGGVNASQVYQDVVVLASRYDKDLSHVTDQLARSHDSGCTTSSDRSGAPASEVYVCEGPLTSAPTELPHLLINRPDLHASSVGGSGTSPLSRTPKQSISNRTIMEEQLTNVLMRRNMEELCSQASKQEQQAAAEMESEKIARLKAVEELAAYQEHVRETEAKVLELKAKLASLEASAQRHGQSASAVRSAISQSKMKLAQNKSQLEEAHMVQEGLVKEFAIVSK
eukprot:gene9977-7857_t